MPAARRYPSDLDDDQRAIVIDLLLPVKSGTPKGGRPAADLREVINSILYILTSGATWRHMPSNLVKWKTAHHWFRGWTKDGTWARIHDALLER